MRQVLLVSILFASAATAQNSTGTSAGRKVGDVLGGPAEDINVKRKAIPPALQAASADPYTSVVSCPVIAQQIGELSEVLGPDFDSGTEASRRISGTKMAKGVVQGFIPFRGVIREVTGAAASERRYLLAVDAGIARRGFLRGLARARRCRG